MAKKYQVVCVSDEYGDQTVTNPLSFEDANSMAALLTADEAIESGSNKSLTTFVVQPAK